MFNGLLQQVSSEFGSLWSGFKSKVQKSSSAVSKPDLVPSVSIAGTSEQQAKVLILPTNPPIKPQPLLVPLPQPRLVSQPVPGAMPILSTVIGQLPFVNPRNDAVTQGATTMSTPPSQTTAAVTGTNIFSELASLTASEVFPPVLTLVNSTLADIEANPQEWVNPITATIKGNAFVTNLIATLPAIENSAVPAAAQLISAVLNTLAAKLSSVKVTAQGVGSDIAQTIISHS